MTMSADDLTEVLPPDLPDDRAQELVLLGPDKQPEDELAAIGES